MVLEGSEPRGPCSRATRSASASCICREVRASDRAHLPGPNQLVERPERVADRDPRIGAMQVVQVDVVGSQPLQRSFDRPAYRLRRGESVTRLPCELRRENDLVPPSLEDLAEQALAATAVPVDLGGVEKRDACVERRIDDGACLVETEAAAEVVAAETDAETCSPLWPSSRAPRRTLPTRCGYARSVAAVRTCSSSWSRSTP